MSSRLLLSTEQGNYRIHASDFTPLVRRNRATGEITCPLDTTIRELEDFTSELLRVDGARPVSFRRVPLLSDPVG